jgi:hypothetical protein
MPLARVVINLGGLNIKLEQESAYPDMVTDLCNRAAVFFGTALAQAQASLTIVASLMQLLSVTSLLLVLSMNVPVFVPQAVRNQADQTLPRL